MRLLFVHDRFGAMAGAEVNALLTATELKSRGHQIALLHGVGTGKGEASWQETFSPCYSLENEPGTSTGQAIASFQPDAIYIHKMSDLRVLAALADSGPPVVRMVHDHDLYCLRSYKYFPLTRSICTRPAGLGCIVPCGAVLARQRGAALPIRWMSYRNKLKEIALNRKFQRMVVATQYMRDELLRNGFDPHRIEIHAPVPRTNSPLPTASFSNRNLIVYSGQVIRGKGVDVLLESLARVSEPFECVILGDGSHRAHCENLSRRLGLQDRVRFTGYVPPGQLQTYYADASAAVVSSVWPEPFGAVGLEAMRHGLPVVAFDAGGIQEWLVDEYNGFLVPWMDRDRFAARVSQLLRDKPLARRLGKQGRALAGERFNFDHYISGLEAMFEQVASKTTSRVAVA